VEAHCHYASRMTTNEPPPYPGQDPQTPSSSGLPSYGSVPPPADGSYPPPPGGQPPAPGGYRAPEGNKKALASMIVGIASLVLGLFCGFLVVGGIVAIVLGVIARGEIARSNGTQTGSGQALTGIITGSVLVALFVLGVILIATGAIDYNFSVES
jgi:hypothetical protein